MDILGANRFDAVKLRESVDYLDIDNHIEVENVSQFPAPATKAVVDDASVLMAVGSTNATNRRGLFLKNTGEGVALISGANSGGGRRLLPGQSILFRFGVTGETETTGESAVTRTRTYASVSIYARAETVTTNIYIEEV